MHGNVNNLNSLMDHHQQSQQQQDQLMRRPSRDRTAAVVERLPPVMVVRQVSPAAGASSHLPQTSAQAMALSANLRREQQQREMVQQQHQQQQGLPSIPMYSVVNGGAQPQPSPFSVAFSAMAGRSVSADDDDEEEDSAVKLCGVADRGKPSGGEFCEGEPPEPQQAYTGGASTSEDSFEEDQEFFELQEREQIVDKYEKGPEQKDVDPWENPDFELYKVTDRYGFVRKELGAELTVEQKRIRKELAREQKWLRMLGEWEQRHPAKLPERIWKGVPDKLRLMIWKKMLGADSLKANSRENLYNELLARARLVSKDIKQIDLDINRTYRDNLAFRRRYDVKQRSLFNVLTAYAMLNTEVGYCQGMSQIAALFLMYMDDETAFWCLHALLVNRKHGMHGFFVPGFPKLLRFQHHYDKVLLKYLPRVKKHLDGMGIPPIYLTKWWFGCFLDRVPFPLALRLWDVFLYFGESVLIAMAYNIMKMHRKRIQKLGVEDFMEFIQNSLSEDFGFSDDAVMESLSECLKRLQNDRMAIPPPPNPNATAELPTKPLGPILTRSMMDIRSDIASVYSRCSRANSLTGRSPMVVRRHHTQSSATANNNTVASKAYQQQQQQRLVAAATARAFVAAQQQSPTEGGGSRPGSLKDRRAAAGGAAADSGCSTPQPPAATGGGPDGVPVEPFLRRVGSTKLRIPKPPPVPDEDGFVRMGPRSAVTKKHSQPNQQQRGSDETPGGGGGSGELQHRGSLHGRQLQEGLTEQQQQQQLTEQVSQQAQQQPSMNHHRTAASRLPQATRSSSLKTQRKTSATTMGADQQQQQKQQTAQPQLHQQQMINAGGQEHRQQRSVDSAGSTISHRVHKAANHVTYISMEETENQQQQPKWVVPMPKTVPTRPLQSSLRDERVPSRLPYYCPPPDYDANNGDGDTIVNRHHHQGGGGGTARTRWTTTPGNSAGSSMRGTTAPAEFVPGAQQRRPVQSATAAAAPRRQPPPHPQPMMAAKPLYARDATSVVRRF